MGPVGALKNACLTNFKAPLPSYMTEDDERYFSRTFSKNGFAGPTCWYKVMVRGLNAVDDQSA